MQTEQDLLPVSTKEAFRLMKEENATLFLKTDATPEGFAFVCLKYGIIHIRRPGGPWKPSVFKERDFEWYDFYKSVN